MAGTGHGLSLKGSEQRNNTSALPGYVFLVIFIGAISSFIRDIISENSAEIFQVSN